VCSFSSFAKLATVTSVTCFLTHKFTFVHPFLLSDNRHYVFYVWKNIFRDNPAAKYLFTPAYLLTAKYLQVKLGNVVYGNIEELRPHFFFSSEADSFVVLAVRWSHMHHIDGLTFN
jgi:hypothetical protein